MSGYAFDTNILTDALMGYQPAHNELRRASSGGGRSWISRIVWIEVMSKSEASLLREMDYFLSGFSIDEIDGEIGARAAAIRRERPRLKAPDAIVLATALTRGRVLVTRNSKDFPVEMPGIRIPYIL